MNEKKMPGMNGTRLSDETVAVTVGYFVEFLSRLGEQLERFRSSFNGPGLAPLRPQEKDARRKKMPGI